MRKHPSKIDRSGRKSRQPARAGARRESPLACLERAIETRRSLLCDRRVEACRIFNSTGDGIDGLVLEKFGEILVAQLHEGQLRLSESAARELCGQAARRLGARAVYRKIHAQDRSGSLSDLEQLHTSPTPWLGEPVEPEIVVRENDLRLRIRPYDGYSVGLFLEQRENRGRIRELAARRSVLNTFAYTCAFSVAAALGKAASTTNVDVSRKYLEWGKRNYEENGIGLSQHQFICSDIFDYYRRAQRQGRRFDLIILDPPTFGRAKRPKRTFVLTEDLERLVRGAVELLEPGGVILLATNCRGISWRRLEKSLNSSTAVAFRGKIRRLTLPIDFQGDADYSKALLARFG